MLAKNESGKCRFSLGSPVAIYFSLKLWVSYLAGRSTFSTKSTVW